MPGRPAQKERAILETLTRFLAASLAGSKRVGRAGMRVGPDVMAGEREIFYEFITLGGSVKVTAIDATTGVEVSIVGAPSAGEAALKRLAKQKLDYVMKRRAAGEV